MLLGNLACRRPPISGVSLKVLSELLRYLASVIVKQPRRLTYIEDEDLGIQRPRGNIPMLLIVL